MVVPDGYVLQDSDYHSNITVQAKYTLITKTYTVVFSADGQLVKRMTVPDGYVLQNSDYPTVPIKFGYTGSWRRVITPIHTDTTVYAVYTAVGGGGGGGGEIIIPPQPTSPGEIMSGGEGEPVEADEPEENGADPASAGAMDEADTVTHDYLTQSGRVARVTLLLKMKQFPRSELMSPERRRSRTSISP